MQVICVICALICIVGKVSYNISINRMMLRVKAKY
jgi:hypothetical protein